MLTVSLESVCKQYGSEAILKDINLSIEPGEFVVIVGPSGCGKSTLLRLIAGLDEPTSGKILINKLCVNEIPAAKRDIAMVFQSYALYPHMSVFDNIAYALKMRRIPAAEIKKQVLAVADMLHLTASLTKKPRDLSGGQRQRVAMGRAIIRKPTVFLFDEPLSNLDAKLRAELRYEIKKMHQRLNTTCIYVTHDQTEAMTMATRIVILNNGAIEQVGTPQDLYHEPASLFVAGFTGHHSSNFLSGILDRESQELKMDFGLSLPAPVLSNSVQSGESIILSLRPEQLQLVKQPGPNTIPVYIEFIDDMGADKLLHTRTHCGTSSFTVRMPADAEIGCDNLAIELLINKANVFQEKTGQRIGGWND